MKFLALDVGEKRIGVARGDDATRIAIPIGFIETGSNQWAELTRTLDFYGSRRLIIGLPRNNQGQETAQSAYVREFTRQLIKRIPGVKVKFQDETLTSVLAEERLKQSGKQYIKGDIDAEAAAIILQDFLDGGVKLGSNPTENAPETQNLAPSAVGELKEEEIAVMAKKRQKTAKKGRKSGRRTAGNGKSAQKAKKGGRSVGSVIGGIFTVMVVLVILGVAGTVGFLSLREQRRAARAAEYAALEAEQADKVFDFTVKPGETIAEIKENLVAAGYDETEVEEAFAANYNFPMLKGRPRGASLEGYLFGETKQFYKTTPVTEVVEFFLQQMQDTIDQNNLEAKFAKQGLTLDQGITLASVVQKEANPRDMPTVAQVFLTRLEEGISLGSDVTVSYAVDMVDPGRIGTPNNQTALEVDSCYNTRLYKGLPCGPISNPGLNALLAVANPSDTSYLYFLTGDDGLMYYSYTEDEHTEMAAEHCQTLCQVSL